jgi:hypothetical protein
MLNQRKTRERKALLKRMRELALEIFKHEGAEQERALAVLKEKNRRAIEELTNPETNPRLH